MNNTKNTSERLSSASVILGIISIFLWEFSIFPIAAIVTGFFAIHKSEDGKPSMNALLGILLGTVFLIVRIAQL